VLQKGIKTFSSDSGTSGKSKEPWASVRAPRAPAGLRGA
jgi:hypothetical protein